MHRPKYKKCEKPAYANKNDFTVSTTIQSYEVKIQPFFVGSSLSANHQIIIFYSKQPVNCYSTFIDIHGIWNNKSKTTVMKLCI